LSGADGFADAVDGQRAPAGFGNRGETGGTAVFFAVLENDRVFHNKLEAYRLISFVDFSFLWVFCA
jgi:hypothetical protein